MKTPHEQIKEALRWAISNSKADGSYYPATEECMEKALALLETHAVVPRELTAENGMKAALLGEFFEMHRYVDDDGEEHALKITCSWTLIKEMHRAMIAAAERGE